MEGIRGVLPATLGSKTLDPTAMVSPSWQRVKWTDGMVRLLIMVVYCIGDDGYGPTEGGDQHHQPATAATATGKGKKGTTSEGTQQKKGKWKSVSIAMMERGFCVSPQQCEDKFNDLNKRYKRVIDLLGKGTACRVVENQALLDTMDHLSRKAKEEARKLLNSKHLFFPEMCAYHNGGNAAACSSSVAGSALHDKDDKEDREEDTDNDDEDYDDNEGYILKHKNDHQQKSARTSLPLSASPSLSLSLSESPKSTSMQELRCELMESLATMGGEEQQRHWLRRKVAELEEQRLGYKHQALEMERKRYKWLRFSSNKEREMEQMKLQNERVRLENDCMLLLLRQKEHELVNVNGTTS